MFDRNCLATPCRSTPEALRAFDRLGYRFCPEESNEGTFIKADERRMA